MTSDIQYHATWNSDRYQDYIAIQFGHIGINILLTFYFIFNMKYIVPITQQKWKIIKVIYFKLKLFQWCFWTAGGEVLWIHTRPSVRPSVRPWRRISVTAPRIFLIFGMKLGDHEWRKVTEPDFPGKIWFAQKRGKRVQNAPKMDLFDI